MDEGNKSRSGPARKIPIPEARMRLQEANQFSTSLEANITRPANVRERSPKVTPKRQSNSIASNIANQRAKNPFDDDDSYDDAKNPFADDENDENDADKVKPFEEYDNNLNPFA